MGRITLVDTFTDALVTALRATTGFRSPTDADDGSGITVFDGPEVLEREDSIRTYVVIGYGGELDLESGQPSDDSSSGDVSFRAIARTYPKEEKSDVECLVVYWTGDTGVAACRSAARAAADAVETVVREDPTIGIAVQADGAQLHWSLVTKWSMRTYLNAGTVTEIRFTLSYYARI